MTRARLGFIGAGNMASAILRGVLQKGFLPASDVLICDVDAAKRDALAARYGVAVAPDYVSLVRDCAFVVLAVKPNVLGGVLRSVAGEAEGKRLISIAAGWTFQMLIDALGADCHAGVLRVMPNTPAMIGESFIAICEQTTMSPDDLQWCTLLLSTLGETAVLPERLFDAVIAVSGSSPAYVYMVIEAMADGAVALGMPRALAYRAAAQAVLGSAKMVLETGEHPGKLKDDVCSPGGTTIEAVRALEKGGMRSAVIEAMLACARKSKEMSQPHDDVRKV